MSIRLPQNPGIGGINELTDAEELFVQNLAGLSYVQGDILYHDGNDLVNLAKGTAAQHLLMNAGATAPEWTTIAAGAGDLLADGTIPLTANWDVGAFTITALTFVSDQATGTAPFTVASTTEVANLKAATVGTITGLAPDTATTQATQAAITSAANLVTVGTIGTGVWEGTTIAVDQGGTGATSYTGGQLLIGGTGGGLAKATLTQGSGGISIANGDSSITLSIAAASTTVVGTIEIATGAETNTGTDATIAVSPDGLDDWTGSAQITTVGTLSAGDVDAAVSASSVTVAGKVELATTAEIDTGTDSTRAMPVDQFVASKRNIRWLVFNLVEAATDCATATNIAGDFVSPIAGTILQSDTTPFYLYATNSTAGTTGTMVVDISIGGTTIMTTNKLDFDTTEKTTTTAATPPDLTTTALAVGDIITIDIDSIHTTAAKGLTVYMAVRE